MKTQIIHENPVGTLKNQEKPHPPLNKSSKLKKTLQALQKSKKTPLTLQKIMIIHKNPVGLSKNPENSIHLSENQLYEF